MDLIEGATTFLKITKNGVQHNKIVRHTSLMLDTVEGTKIFDLQKEWGKFYEEIENE